MHRTFYRLLLPTLLALSLALPTRTFAQDTTGRYARPNVLKTNLLAPPSLFYERALTRRFALRLSTRGLRISRGVYENQSFVNVAVEGKVYTAKPARLAAKPHPTGFFVSPYLKARSMRYIERIGYGFTDPGDLDEIQVKGVAMGLTIGYQWVSHNGSLWNCFTGAVGSCSIISGTPCGTAPSYRNQTITSRLIFAPALVWATPSDLTQPVSRTTVAYSPFKNLSFNRLL